MGVSVKTKPKAKVKAKARVELVQRLEAVALCFMDVARRAGCKGSEMQVIARAIAFQLIAAVIVEAVDDEGITVGDLRCSINYDTHAIEIDNAPELEIDPTRPIAEQVSGAFRVLLRDLNDEWRAEGARQRVIKVVFCSDIYDDEHRLSEARRLLGVDRSTSDWGDYEPEAIGSFTPGRLKETNIALRGRKRKGS